MVADTHRTVNERESATLAADALRDAGIAICKPDRAEKKPTYRGWSTRSLEASDFAEGDMIGIMGGPLSSCGRPGHALVIVDLDSADAVVNADDHLPTTGMEEGRSGKPRSHRYYLVPLDSIPPWAVSGAEQASKAAIEATGHAGPFLKHFHHQDTRKGVLDFIGTGGQVVCPPSLHHTGEVREWVGGQRGEPAVVPFADLWDAVCDLAVVCGCGDPRQPATQTHCPAEWTGIATDGRPDAVTRCIAYLATVDPAVSGQDGHGDTYWPARVAAWGFDLGADVAFDVLWNHYNHRCDPPWSERELRHKCHDADTQPFNKPRGWLLNTERSRGNGHARTQTASSTNAANPILFTNFYYLKSEQGEDVRVCYSPAQIAEQLERITPGWPKCVGDRLVVVEAGYEPRWLDSADALFAWIGRQLPKSESNPISWASQGANVVSQSRFAAYLRQTAPRYRSLARFPHWPPVPETLYVHPPLRGGDGKALARLLSRFMPDSPVDRDLILALFLTLVWGGAPGRRPAWLISRNPERGDDGRGLGKSTLAHLASRTFGGHLELALTAKRDEIATRLLSDNGQSLRVALLDNIKTLKLSWSELEGLITSPVISGHQMYVGEGQRPNLITWIMTLNGASLGKDVSQRVVPIWLSRARYSASWREDVEQLIDEERWAIIGDLIAILQADPTQSFSEFSRWSDWERDVLARVANPLEAQTTIRTRQGEMDVDQEESDLVREYFASQLCERGHDTHTEVILITSALAAAWLGQAMDNQLPTNKATAHLRQLNIPELRKSDRGSARGWVWYGSNASPGTTAQPLRPAPATNPF